MLWHRDNSYCHEVTGNSHLTQRDVEEFHEMLFCASNSAVLHITAVVEVPFDFMSVLKVWLFDAL